MSTPVEKATTLKGVKIAEETWRSVSHESTDRGATIGALLAVAWNNFMTLPVARRVRLIEAAGNPPDLASEQNERGAA